MNICVGKSLKRMAGLLVSVSLVGGLSACSTTSTMRTTQAAPVTYKIGGGNSSYAAVTMPEKAPAPATNLPHTAPSQSPLAVPRPAPLSEPKPQSSANAYDLSNIDRGLYDHMKVGKPYKVAGKSYTPGHNPDYDKIGVASWYGDKFHGKPTANGEIYDKNALTAAHKTLPLNSYVIVTNLDNGKSIKVRLNDRGPFIDNRIIDLSEAAAGGLGIKGEGLGRVRVQYAGAAPKGGGTPFVPTQPSQHAERAEEPKPAPQSSPEPMTAPSPIPPILDKDGYQPLRNGGTQAENVAVPAPQYPQIFEVPSILDGGSNDGFEISMPQRADRSPQVPIPEPIEDLNNDDVITLTIKGPVHMAGTKTTIKDNQGQPELIPAVHQEEK